MNAPFFVRPHYVAKPWGGRRLADELGRGDLPEGPVGESWEVADTPEVQSRVEGGPHDGRSLREVWGAPFPLLLKVLDAVEDLSVQVHPDGREGGPAKEEAWVALGDGGAVALGSAVPDAAPEEILGGLTTQHLRAGRPVGREPPSVIHVPPGTVHAVLGGALLFEVQNPVDRTWRLYDHGRTGLDGRPRALHRAEAAALLARGAPPAARFDPAAGTLAAERFTLRLLPPGEHEAPPGLAAFFMDAGEARAREGAVAVPRGRTVLLPGGAQVLASEGWIVLCDA